MKIGWIGHNHFRVWSDPIFLISHLNIKDTGQLNISHINFFHHLYLSSRSCVCWAYLKKKFRSNTLSLLKNVQNNQNMSPTTMNAKIIEIHFGHNTSWCALYIVILIILDFWGYLFIFGRFMNILVIIKVSWVF